MLTPPRLRRLAQQQIRPAADDADRPGRQRPHRDRRREASAIDATIAPAATSRSSMRPGFSSRLGAIGCGILSLSAASSSGNDGIVSLRSFASRWSSRSAR